MIWLPALCIFSEFYTGDNTELDPRVLITATWVQKDAREIFLSSSHPLSELAILYLPVG